MRNKLLVLFLGLLLLPTTACLLSLRPLYDEHTDKDIVFEPALFGVWTDISAEGGMIIVVTEAKTLPNVISPADKNSYVITVVITGAQKGANGENEEEDATLERTTDPFPMKYRGRLVRVGDHLFLDLVPHEDFAGGLALMGLLSTHMFYRVQIGDDALRVESVNDKLIEDPEERYLRHESLEMFSPTLLTAFPPEIKERLKKHQGKSAIYDQPQQFRRVK